MMDPERSSPNGLSTSGTKALLFGHQSILSESLGQTGSIISNNNSSSANIVRFYNYAVATSYGMDTFFIFGAKYFYIAIVAVALIYFINQTKDRRREIVLLGILALPVMYVVAKIVGFFYYSTLPFVEGDFTPLIPHEVDNGFPSDHTLLSAGISSIFCFFNKKLSAVLWAMTIVVGLSRVYAGVHHNIDIAGSILIAIAITILMYILISRWKKGIIGKMK